jgi:hypothetical protein
MHYQLTPFHRVWKVTSEITGPMVVEDVVYENVADQNSTSEKMFRRLVFKRSSGLVQSESLLIRDFPSDDTEKKNKSASAASKKRRNQKKGMLFFLCKLECAVDLPMASCHIHDELSLVHYIHDDLFILFHLSLTIKTRMVNPLVLFLVLLASRRGYVLYPAYPMYPAILF